MTTVYVINLTRSTERMARMTDVLSAAGLGFRRVEAVDCRDMADSLWTGRYDAARNRKDYLAPLSPAEIACFLSHRAAWQRFLEDGEAESAVVLEDDVRTLAPGDELLDFVHRTCGYDAPVLCKLNALRSGTRHLRPARVRRPLLPGLTAAAQALNRPAAKRLLEFTDTFHEPVDVALQRWWDHGVRVLQASPPLFAELRGRDYNSTIRDAREGPAEGRLLRELRRPVFQLRRAIRAASAGLSPLRD